MTPCLNGVIGLQALGVKQLHLYIWKGPMLLGFSRAKVQSRRFFGLDLLKNRRIFQHTVPLKHALDPQPRVYEGIPNSFIWEFGDA